MMQLNFTRPGSNNLSGTVIPFAKPRFAGQEAFKFDDFHAHIYFDRKNKAVAENVKNQIPARFPDVTLGKMFDMPVGPHPKPMFSLYFKEPSFSSVTQWLMENRQGLTVLIHPETQDELKDHTERPLWMGKPVKLKLDIFG